MKRETFLSQIRQIDCCDLLVIGGGAVGCGIALDAANRGLSVVLVEQNDFAEGTSSRSSKLLYDDILSPKKLFSCFAPGSDPLLQERFDERFQFLRNAPHLTRVLPLVFPQYTWRQLSGLFSRCKLLDLLSGRRRFGPSGFQNAAQVLKEFPFLNRQGLIGGVRYYDGLYYDSRLALALALTAAEQGALIANHLAVVDFIRQQKRIAGARLEDRLSGERFDLSARTVVNATGPFVDRLRQLADPMARPLISLSSGTHIILDQSYPPPRAGMLLRVADAEETLFVLPWLGRCLVGTVSRSAELSEHPQTSAADLDYLLRLLQKVLDPVPKKGDIRAVWSGLKPLIRGAETNKSPLRQDDFVIDATPNGLLTIVGGKWTSYRKMAEKLVDRVVSARTLPAKPCGTRELHLQGGGGWQPTGWQLLAKHFLLDEATARYLHASYGTRATEVAKLAVGPLLEPLVEGFACIGAEVVYAVKNELAERAIDVLARRMPLALLDTQRARQAAGQVIQLMAEEKSWSPARRLAEQQLVEQRLTEAL